LATLPTLEAEPLNPTSAHAPHRTSLSWATWRNGHRCQAGVVSLELLGLVLGALVYRPKSLGAPDSDELRWTATVRPGHTRRTRMTGLSARPMHGRPGAGLLESRWEVFDQRDELVLGMSGWGMLSRRAAPTAPG
jgi:acyl dehydratase